MSDDYVDFICTPVALINETLHIQFERAGQSFTRGVDISYIDRTTDPTEVTIGEEQVVRIKNGPLTDILVEIDNNI